MEGKDGYIGLYKGKRFEVFADSSYDAQCIIAKENNIKKRHLISVFLAEKDGKQVTHTPDF